MLQLYNLVQGQLGLQLWACGTPKLLNSGPGGKSANNLIPPMTRPATRPPAPEIPAGAQSSYSRAEGEKVPFKDMFLE